MRRPYLMLQVVVLLTGLAMAVLHTRRIGRQPDGSYLIPTGQTITPVGVHIEVADRPLGLARSPDGRSLAVVTGSNFAPRSLHLIDIAQEKVIQSLPMGDSFVGVAFSADGKRLYVGGGSNHDVKVFARGESGSFAQEATIQIAGGAPSGLALSGDGRQLYVALNLKHALAVIDLETKKVEQLPVGSYPYGVVVDGAKVYVSNWGGRTPKPGDTTDGSFPVVLDQRTGIPASGTISVINGPERRVERHIEVGLHPSGMALDAKRRRLYIANANSDSVSVLDTGSDALIGSIDVRLGRRAPLGSAPNALALDSAGSTLYVANGANNAVAVVDTGKRAVEGFIPTGWYPTAVALSADGKKLFVASGYGFGSLAATPADRKGRSYRDRAGVVSAITLGKPGALTREVMRNNNVDQGPGPRPVAGHPVPMDDRRPSPIKHVFYVIKENRTYDQVFGGLPQGNGDPSLVHFGRDVTPNHHALAEQFVLLDNYYAPGDQSALGHRWCTQGYASDWIHKYGNARNDANPMLFAPTDFLWDNARARGLTVRAYGERGVSTIEPKTARWLDIYRDWQSKTGAVRISARPLVLGLREIYHPRFAGFNMNVPDQVRMDEFLQEFRQFEVRGNLPRLIVMLLPQDHTQGTAPGYPTPRACVADNDLALGRLVEAVSNSRFWKESVIFVTEDDAQNGLDHVDGHRTVGLVIGPWVKRKFVDSTFYTTINMYRTIEQILGLPPSNQFDLAADPMFNVFAMQADATPYTALPNRIPLDEMNPALGALRGEGRRLAESSRKMDFSEPDVAPEDQLNEAIWFSIHGGARKYPGNR